MLIATKEEMHLVKAELLHHRQSAGMLGIRIISEEADSRKCLLYKATTLLHLAAKYGDTKVTRYLIDSGYNVDTTNLYGCTPLMVAIHFNEHKVIQMLLDANADMFLRNRIGKCAANLGLRDQNTALMILEKIKLMCCNDSQATAKKLLEIGCPLARATLLKDTLIINYMLDNGRAVDEIDCCTFLQSTALHNAVRLKDLNMVNLLLDREADVNVIDRRGFTPLCQYSTKSEETSEHEILKALLNKGAALNVLIMEGLTLIRLFLRYGRIGTVRILIEHLGDLSSQKENGIPLLHMLMANRNPGISLVWKNQDWDFNVLDFEGRPTLFKAVMAGSIESVGVLLKNSADVNFVTSNGHTALLYIALYSSIKKGNNARYRLKCVEILLRHGADAQCVIGERVSIFEGIIRHNNFPLAKIIIAHLALTEVLGKPIKELIISKINSNIAFKKYFNLCKRWLQKMLKTVIDGPLTLFEFLTESERNMRVRARNPKIVSQLERIMHTQRRSTMYYCNILRKRIKTVIRNAQLKKEVTNFVSKNLELCNNDYLIEMIVEYSMDL